MTKYLKYVLMIIAALYVLGSCKLYQRKNKEDLQSSGMFVQKEEAAQHWYSLQRDSLSRSWYFWTDSSFRFHPDSGLIGQRGRLFMQESKSNRMANKSLSTNVTALSAQRCKNQHPINADHFPIQIFGSLV